jgi:M6 family metalloprotease-like protein
MSIRSYSCLRYGAGLPACLIVAAACLAGMAVLAPAQSTQNASQIPPIDPQRVQDQDDMTWVDYHPIPGANWADPSHTPQRTIKVALIACDFEDQPFVMTLPKNSDLFGNPQFDPVPRDQIAKFYASFWNGQSPLHHDRTVNEYWMEQSHGKIGVSFEAFGPYRMPKKLFQYGLTEYGQNRYGPGDTPIDGNLTRDCDALWRAGAGDVRNNYQLILRIFAGYDETCVWQEFGEMKFQTRDDIPPEWGNPDPSKPRWAPTRYIPWTSWKAAEMPWSNSSIINGESSGSIVHEVSHAAFSIGDNNNNPYVEPYRRAGSGPWDIMDRGSFNGPGGPHNRWQIPVVQGGSMPAGLMLRQKISFQFLAPANVLQLSREGLAKSGLVVATVKARSASFQTADLAGIVVQLDGPEIPIPPAAISSAVRGATGRGSAGGRGNATQPDAPDTAPQTTPDTPAPAASAPTRGRGRGRAGPATTTRDRDLWEDPANHPLSQGIPDYNNYTLEVVQRIGFDSFCPDSGVLIAKNKDRASSNGGPNSFAVFNWVIDAHPEDIHKMDFKRPNGEVVWRTIADYRQLNDALFHAGLNSDSQYEFQDTPNRLHFYIIDLHKEADGILAYTLGIRSLDGAGPQRRGLTIAADTPQRNTPLTFTLTNTGAASPTDPSLHSQDTSTYLTSDIYRLKIAVQGPGLAAQLQNALVAVSFGQSQKIPVYITSPASGPAAITLTATSESDPMQSQSATCQIPSSR